MAARDPPLRTSHVQVNGDIGDERRHREYIGEKSTVMTSGKAPASTGDNGVPPRYRHIKDLQAKAESQAAEWGPLTPV